MLFLRLLFSLFAILPLFASGQELIVLAGTHSKDSTYLGRLVNLVYADAFSRLGLRFEYRDMPPLRLFAELDAGNIDGVAARGYAFAERHPGLVRVESEVCSVSLVGYTLDPAIRLNGWSSFKDAPWRVEYRAGYDVARIPLEGSLPPARLSAATDGLRGLRKLALGRSDVYVDVEDFAGRALQRDEFKRSGIRPAGTIERVALYPFLRAGRTELAARLAAVLKTMKASGAIESYKRQALSVDLEGER
jgi:ABC-type amino acid transport substrate-binding protein